MSTTDTGTDYEWLNELRAQALTPSSTPTNLGDLALSDSEPSARAASAPTPSAPTPSAQAPTKPPRTAGEFWTVRSLSGGAGRSVIALNLAFEAARTGKRVCLVDLDAHAPSLQVWLNLPNAKTAVLAAIRLVLQDRLDQEALEGLLLEVSARDASVDFLSSGTLTFGTVELHGAEVLLRALTQRYDLVIADTAAGHGTELHRLLGRLADKQLLVVPAEPVALGRLFAGGLATDLAGASVLFNRVRSAVLGSNPEGQLKDLCEKHGAFEVSGSLPLEQEIFDLAQQRGVSLRMINGRAKSLAVLAALLGSRPRSLSARRHRG